MSSRRNGICLRHICQELELDEWIGKSAMCRLRHHNQPIEPWKLSKVLVHRSHHEMWRCHVPQSCQQCILVVPSRRKRVCNQVGRCWSCKVATCWYGTHCGIALSEAIPTHKLHRKSLTWSGMDQWSVARTSWKADCVISNARLINKHVLLLRKQPSGLTC